MKEAENFSFANAEKSESGPYKYDIVCSYCGETISTKKTNDIKMSNQKSHGVCKSCFRREVGNL